MDFLSFPLPNNLLIFVSGAAAIWVSGTLLAGYADEIARRTGVGHVLVGLFLLAGVTSLPEIATSFTAAFNGDAELAVSSLLGSTALQVTVLAIGDLIYSKRALTYVVPEPALMLQGTLSVILLSLVAAGIVNGDWPFLGAGGWTWSLFVAALYAFYKLHEAEQREPWIANISEDEVPQESGKKEAASPVRWLPIKTFFCAITILVAGVFVAGSGGAIAAQTGIGSSFMGMAFLALSNTLPEVSTIFSAMRQRLYSLAISDIFGANIINIVLVFGVDLLGNKGPVLNELGEFAILGALLGVILISLFLMGLAERRDRAFLRMGEDSVLVLLFYAIGMVLLYNL